MRLCNTLAWPQNVRNPIAEELDFKNTQSEDARDPLKGEWPISYCSLKCPRQVINKNCFQTESELKENTGQHMNDV